MQNNATTQHGLRPNTMQQRISPHFIEPSDTRWLGFINSCPDANIFHHPAWIQMMSECYEYRAYVLAVTNSLGRIAAGLPVMKVSSPLTGRRWVALPYSDYCGPLYRNEAALEELTTYLVSLYQAEDVSRIEVRGLLAQRPLVHHYSDFVVHTLALDPDSCKVSKHIKRTHLQNIHTAKERGVTVEFGSRLEDIQSFYRLQLQTRKRHGVPSQPWKYFELLWQHIIKSGMGFVMLAHKDEETIGGMVCLGWGRSLIAKYAASREDCFNLRPNNLLFWESIQWGCARGFEVFDMGRTEVANIGLRTFKSRWGAVEQPLCYSVIPERPHTASGGLFAKAMETIIRKSPPWVCRLSGELLYRHFG